jgi:hypothetical protein
MVLKRLFHKWLGEVLRKFKLWSLPIGFVHWELTLTIRLALMTYACELVCLESACHLSLVYIQTLFV